MPEVAFYLFLHQPYRLANLDITHLDNGDDYFATSDYDQNKEVFLKVTEKSYLPMLRLLLDLVEKFSTFKFSFSATGVFLEQAQAYAP
ncbi:MAG: alpha-amylase, partial [bacterium]|nr:alpha-amylase [bacterium]